MRFMQHPARSHSVDSVQVAPNQQAAQLLRLSTTYHQWWRTSYLLEQLHPSNWTFYVYCILFICLIIFPFISLTSSLTNINSSSAINSPIASNSSQINITILVESANSRQQSMERGPTRKNLEARLITKINHVLTLFNSKTRVELIAMEVQDNVINCLANGLRLDMDEKHFSSNWSQCLENLNNIKSKKQLSNFRLDEMLRDFRYVKKSKVFVFLQFKKWPI